MTNPTKHPIYLIVWKDAQSDPDWEDKDKTDHWGEEDCVVYEIGWIVKETKSHVVVCSQISRDGDFGSKTKIPVGMIISKQKVKTWIKLPSGIVSKE